MCITERANRARHQRFSNPVLLRLPTKLLARSLSHVTPRPSLRRVARRCDINRNISQRECASRSANTHLAGEPTVVTALEKTKIAVAATTARLRSLVIGAMIGSRDDKARIARVAASYARGGDFSCEYLRRDFTPSAGH